MSRGWGDVEVFRWGVGVFTRRRETVKRGLGGDRHFLKGAVVVWSSGGPVVEGATWWD
jgi:hypothetical protein